MHVIVVTPPDPVITVAEAKMQLRVDGDYDDALIEGMIAAAQASLNPSTEAGSWFGRAVGQQTLEARFDGFGCAPLRLPYPPVMSIVSVTYVDAGGAEQTVSSSGYELFGSELVTAFGATWPSSRSERGSVRVRYVAGSATLHPTIRAALLMMVDNLYHDRGGETGMTPMVEELLGADAGLLVTVGKNLSSRLRERVSIQEKNLVDNGRGGRKRPEGGAEWLTIATVSAEVIPLRGDEALSNAVQRSVQLYRVTIRNRAGVLAEQRLLWGAIAMNIVALAPTDDRSALVMTGEAGRPS